MPRGVPAPLFAGADRQMAPHRRCAAADIGGVPPSLFADRDHPVRVNVGAPRAPGIDVAVARAVGYDRLAAVWKPVLSGPPIAFTCGRCGATFATTGDLRGHVARHRSHAAEARQRVPAAAHS